MFGVGLFKADSEHAIKKQDSATKVMFYGGYCPLLTNTYNSSGVHDHCSLTGLKQHKSAICPGLLIRLVWHR